MRSLGRILLLLAAAVAASARAGAEIPLPPIPARAYLLVDHLTGTVLAEHNADERLPPASLTKLMTAYVVFEALRDGRLTLEERVPISEKAWRMRGSRMFIEVGSEVAVEDLLRGLLVQSGNDASVALAERLAGSERAFVDMMNDRAAALGMQASVFRNSTGLPAPGHLSTARDLSRLAEAILAHYPEHRGLYAEREFTYNGIRQHNRNRLLWRDASVDGLKTGYTSGAGYCLVGTATRSGARLVAVVLGAETPAARLDAGQRLLDYGFEAFETHKLFAAGEPLTAARVWKGVADSAPVGLAHDVYVTIPRGAYEALSAVMKLQAELIAPLEPELKIGEVNVSLQGRPLMTTPLVVLEPVSRGGAWIRFKDQVLMWLQRGE